MCPCPTSLFSLNINTLQVASILKTKQQPPLCPSFCPLRRHGQASYGKPSPFPLSTPSSAAYRLASPPQSHRHQRRGRQRHCGWQARRPARSSLAQLPASFARLSPCSALPPISLASSSWLVCWASLPSVRPGSSSQSVTLPGHLSQAHTLMTPETSAPAPTPLFPWHLYLRVPRGLQTQHALIPTHHLPPNQLPSRVQRASGLERKGWGAWGAGDRPRSSADPRKWWQRRKS